MLRGAPSRSMKPLHLIMTEDTAIFKQTTRGGMVSSITLIKSERVYSTKVWCQSGVDSMRSLDF